MKLTPVFYILSILLAQVVTAKIAPFNFGALIIPAGSLLIGCTFVLRDLTQKEYGRKNTYYVIVAAFGLSGILSIFFDDVLQIVIASLLAFIVSEVTDTEIFTRLKTKFTNKVLISGIVGGSLDSVIFVIVGLSPIGLGFLTWEQCLFAIIGQMGTKILMQFAGAGIIGVLLRMHKI
jgi:queuosine precursor transporter